MTIIFVAYFQRFCPIKSFLLLLCLKYNFLFCCCRAKSYMRDGKYENVVSECTAEIDSGGEHSGSARSVITHNFTILTTGTVHDWTKIRWILRTHVVCSSTRLASFCCSYLNFNAKILFQLGCVKSVGFCAFAFFHWTVAAFAGSSVEVPNSN